MPGSRELDSSTQSADAATTTLAAASVTPIHLLQSRTNALTGAPSIVPATGPVSTGGSLIGRAMAFAKSEGASFGFAPGSEAEFIPDPVIPKTSAGAQVVNLKQSFQGITVFRMSRSVRFSPDGQLMDAFGDTASIPDGFDIEPKLPVTDAVLKGATHLAATGNGEMVTDDFGQESPVPTIDITDFQPQVVAGFPLPSRPTVLDKGPFENPIPAHLLIFIQPEGPRLGWYAVFTFPNYSQQYAIIIAADNPDGEVLYCRSMMTGALARGRVYEFSPGVADRRMVDFPRPLSDYPAMPTTPISAFPDDWIELSQTRGNTCGATLNFTQNTLTGTLQGGVVEFDPVNNAGDDQKLLNIFYFCNYMHDFLYILGFDEASGNFQQVNVTHQGIGGDRVRALAHSGPVDGVANMFTGPDGLPPVMNMGLLANTGRHTAFDADVVFHEYVHGLTNRMVMGGRMNAPHSLADAIQSRGMGEGWSDFYALTIGNFFRTQEKTVTGDWVSNNPAGIRRRPYDDAYPFKYGQLKNFPEVHNIGEVWCAALMMMTRRLRLAMGNDQQGYRLAWQIVTDGLKLTRPLPTFLDARDGILRAIEDLGSTNRIPPAIFKLARKSAWLAFAHFEMGANARSADANNLISIVPDTTVPAGI